MERLLSLSSDEHTKLYYTSPEIRSFFSASLVKH
jgi:hypothetical protein